MVATQLVATRLVDQNFYRLVASSMKRISIATCLLFATVLAGCKQFIRYEERLRADRFVSTVQNPLPVSGDRDFIWEQIVDTVDDYFDVEKEQRPRQMGSVVTEGRLTTVPDYGASRLEPWRRDSTPGFERWLATFQTIRREATVRVIPNGGINLVEVIVEKSLEDRDQPLNSTVRTRTRRHDGSLVRPESTIELEEEVEGPMRWIPIGRDHSLEQQILEQLRARLTFDEAAEPQGRPFWHKHR